MAVTSVSAFADCDHGRGLTRIKLPNQEPFCYYDVAHAIEFKENFYVQASILSVNFNPQADQYNADKDCIAKAQRKADRICADHGFSGSQMLGISPGVSANFLADRSWIMAGCTGEAH